MRGRSLFLSMVPTEGGGAYFHALFPHVGRRIAPLCTSFLSVSRSSELFILMRNEPAAGLCVCVCRQPRVGN